MKAEIINITKFNTKRLVFNYFYLLIFFFSFLCKGQEARCKEYAIYKQAFSKVLLTSKDTVVIQLKKYINPLILKDLKVSGKLSHAEIGVIVEKLSQEWNPKSCPKIENLLLDLTAISSNAKSNSYVRRYYSQPIFLNEKKAVMLLSFSTRSKIYKGGKAIGMDLLEIYGNVNGIWQSIDRIALSMY